MEWTVEQYLRDDPRLSRTDLEYIKEWHKKQPHLPPMTDSKILLFLHCNEYSLERTKVCIDKYYTMQTHAPELFANRDVLLPVNMKQTDFTVIAEIPKRDSNGYRVLGMGLQNVDDLSDFVAARSAFMTCIMIEQLIREWPTSPGYTIIMDAQNLQMGHLMKAPLPLLKKILTYVQEAAPLRLRNIHIINIHPIVETVMVLIKPLLGEELQKLLKFHSDSMESFYEELPRDMLPHEFGGTSGSALEYHNQLLKRVIENREAILQEDVTVDESRRPGRARDASDVFGMEGSFKKLDID